MVQMVKFPTGSQCVRNLTPQLENQSNPRPWSLAWSQSHLTLTYTCVQNKSSENTVGKGEIDHNSNFSFSCSIFYPFGEVSAIFIKLEIVVCKLFQFGRAQNLLFGKG